MGILISISKKNLMLNSAVQEKSLNYWYLISFSAELSMEKSFITSGALM